MDSDRSQAIGKIEEACKHIALQFMRIHPVLPSLGDEEVKADCLKSLHTMTTELETIKKRLIKLKGADDSTEL